MRHSRQTWSRTPARLVCWPWTPRRRNSGIEWKAGKKDTRDRLDLVLGKLEGDRERAVRVGVLAEAAAHHSRWSGAPEPMVTVDAADFRTIAPWYGWSAHTHLPPLAAWVLAAAGLPVPHHPDAPPDAGDAAEHG